MRCRHIATLACMVSALTPTLGMVHAQDGEIVVRGTDSVIGIHRDELTEKIEQAIRNGALYLRNNQSRDGSWIPPDTISNQAHVVGATGVILMGLLYSGVNTDSPTILRGLNFLAQNEGSVNNSYTRGAVLSALVMSDPLRRNRQVTRLVERQVHWLLQAQENNRDDLWRYTLTSRDHDMSCVQFAVEALRMAHTYGYQLPPAPLAKARNAVLKFQRQDGSWAYTPTRGGKVRASSLSMTAATVGSLASLDAILAPFEGRTRRDPNVDRGLKALNKLYSATSEQYIAYSVERAGILTGTRFIGEEDWYRAIAQRMLAQQNDDGSFHNYGFGGNKRTSAFSTGFTLLFLGKGLAPTIVGRLDWGPPSTSTAYDMHYLTGAVTRELSTHLNWINIPVDASIDEFVKVPVIYVTGDEDPYDRLIQHREKFIDYFNKGGTLLGTGTENNKAFEDGFVRFIKEIQPDAEFEPVPANDPIYRRWHTIRRPYGLFATRSAEGGRPLVLLIKNPFALPLSTQRHRNTRQATEMGTNIIVFLTQIDARPNLLEDIMK